MTIQIKAASRLANQTVTASARTKKFAEQVAVALGASASSVVEDDVAYSFTLKTTLNLTGSMLTALAKVVGQNSMAQIWAKGTAAGIKVTVRDKRDY